MLNRRSLLASLLAGALAPLALSADAQAQPAPTSRPPAPRREARPPSPGRGYDWIPGHWSWDRRRGWVWNRGYWERRRIGFEFVGPRWVLRRGQWVYEPGRWVPARRW